MSNKDLVFVLALGTLMAIVIINIVHFILTPTLISYPVVIVCPVKSEKLTGNITSSNLTIDGVPCNYN